MHTALFASIFAAAALLAPVAPAGADSPAVTIGELEAQGFNVNVDRIGNRPIDQCVVTSVRSAGFQQQFVEVNGHGNNDFLVPVIVRRTVTVSLDCTG